MKIPKLILLTGPTGVGKTDLSILIAQALHCEIINCDSGQFYTSLRIGTAKPDWHSMPVAHHLFGIIDEPQNISVIHYLHQVGLKVAEIQGRGKNALVVGGSMFYAYSLFFPPQQGENITSSDESFKEATTQDLWQRLHAIDPVRALQIYQTDRYRIERALTIFLQTGRLPSLCKPLFDPLEKSFFIIHATRERQDLYHRINERTVSMLYKKGWIAEVKNLDEQWHIFLQTKQFIGYPHIIDFIQGAISNKEKLCSMIQQETRQYAKRQLVFWKRMQRLIEDESPHSTEQINLTFLDVDLYIKQLQEKYLE